MLNIKKIIFTTCFSLFVMLSLLTPVLAADADVWGGQEEGIGNAIGLGGGDPRVIAAKIIRVFLGFLGIIAVV
ncbi:hypothetical protein KKB14_00240, partial [Patescibacteria group bacterium]|nr:hypothetical protein [Patescibacteria group bacterium]